MRAIRADRGTFLLDTNAAAPAVGAGEALVRVTRVGVGPGDRRGMPTRGIPGCRFVGTIEQQPGKGADGASGADSGLSRGTRVVAKPLIRCGTCDLCQGGLGDHCRNRVTLGSSERDGCLADLVAVPTENLVALPDKVDDDAGVFAWVLAGAMHVAHMMRVDGRAFVTVLGDDAMGLMCAQWLASQNTTVRLLGWDTARFGLCERWGVKHRHADEVGRRADQDVVIDCTNAAAGLELAMQLVRPRGTILVRGSAPAGVDLAPIADSELTLMGSRAGNLREAVATLATGKVDVLSLITRRVRLEDVPGVLANTASSGEVQTLVEV